MEKHLGRKLNKNEKEKYKQKIRIKMQNKDYMIQKMHSRFRNVGKKEQYNVF